MSSASSPRSAPSRHWLVLSSSTLRPTATSAAKRRNASFMTNTLILTACCGIQPSTVNAQRMTPQLQKKHFRDQFAGRCKDNPTYRTKLGMTCDQHETVQCEAFIHLANFEKRDVEELLEQCPVSCNSCPKPKSNNRIEVNSHRTVDEDSLDFEDLNRMSLTAPSLDVFESLDEAACHDGWDPLCTDDASYVSKLSFICEQHTNVDCTSFGALGFTEEEVVELVNRCPCSCKIPCGTFTMQPTASPEPSSVPSAHPSHAPTVTRSTSPSSSPTLQHSEVPTVTESDAPSTYPTLQHSEVPTSEPSPVPTSEHSTSPSALPSAAPVTSS
eukprot:CAMPEP_0178642996 /NCGR_PEP_ID=MMETSP0698-20121128/17477_1 /TAXON_ID=265572 /ORGANISM="Extubocellulus spinifer, Strain CCMP396" /LENGTH=327 /DNA_ID=CAMNT_0020283799 /DNA_START=69 /DNA_END=1048 /DNA_ORIENTATION=+